MTLLSVGFKSFAKKLKESYVFCCPSHISLTLEGTLSYSSTYEKISEHFKPIWCQNIDKTFLEYINYTNF